VKGRCRGPAWMTPPRMSPALRPSAAMRRFSGWRVPYPVAPWSRSVPRRPTVWPMPDTVPVDEELRPGVALWEAGRYVEAHEEFEHLWLVEVGPRRHFLRGLVHAAMGFHYLTVGDLISARSKLASAANLLDGFPGDFLGLDVDGLRAGILASQAAEPAISAESTSSP